ncbi:hypothetical protein B296_00047048 [Ensete ventricosum]|uniref:Uncharacterized protein n=1 Tax=Ensete ventricosum TaxID=4639 RepID=A0A426XF95_ENSVE|nr:hypothetical protein B296_00047048 [Ensete ventricosum]
MIVVGWPPSEPVDRSKKRERKGGSQCETLTLLGRRHGRGNQLDCSFSLVSLLSSSSPFFPIDGKPGGLGAPQMKVPKLQRSAPPIVDESITMTKRVVDAFGQSQKRRIN